MTRFESRPARTGAAGSTCSSSTSTATATTRRSPRRSPNWRRRAPFLKVLGSYPGGARLTIRQRRHDCRPARSRPPTCARSRPTCPASRSRSVARELGSRPRRRSSSSRPTRIRAAPSPQALAAIAAAAARRHALSRTATASTLKAALAQRSASTPAQIVLGNGSQRHARARRAGLPRARRRGGLLAARVRRLSARDAGARRDAASRCRRATTATTSTAMRAAITPRHAHRVRRQSRTIRPARCSPPAELEAFIARVPRDVLVVLDEAYNEYLPPDCSADSVGWLARYPNLVVSRTFSKAYGLAGAARRLRRRASRRWPTCMNRVRQPFNVNALALAAAIAALDDTEFVDESRARQPRRACAQLERGLRSARPRVHSVARQLHHSCASATRRRVYQRAAARRA